ncbi:MAG: caspase family protein [bacterium]
MNYIKTATHILAILLMTTYMSSVSGEERIALVVGNGEYQTVDKLSNPVSDAKLITSKLENLGFKINLVTDTDLAGLKKAIAEFGRQLRAGGKDATGLFYYAGHGVQSFGSNYLLPVDTQLSDAADLDLVAVEASTILRQMFSARNKTNVFILDACRNNPFSDIPDFGDSGLAEMKAPTGTFLAYATAPGNVALDGDGTNSPFTAALAQEMTDVGVPIEQVFKQVRVRVLEQTQGAQTPWDTSSLTGQFYFAEPVVLSEDELLEQRMWESARLSGDMLQLMLFIRTYPDSQYKPEARLLLSKAVAELDAASSDASVQRSASESLPTKATVSPQAEEKELIERAQSSGKREDYEAYLDKFPEGIYVELVKSEILTIEEKLQSAVETKADKQEVEIEDVQKTETAAISGSQVDDSAEVSAATIISFDSPLTEGGSEVVGKSIAELVEGNPLHPPIEGLPESVWRDQSCSNCHNWTKEALCTQSQVYTGENAEKSLVKKHPYGGSFKRNLKVWALSGCQ